jgi:hypothetical protein
MRHFNNKSRLGRGLLLAAVAVGASGVALPPLPANALPIRRRRVRASPSISSRLG